MKLIPCSKEHYETIFAWRQQKSSLAHNPVKNTTLDEFRVRCEGEGTCFSDLTTHKVYRWVGEVEGEIVGNINLKEINLVMNYAEIGYGIDEKVQGRGYGTEMVRLFVNKVFSETPIRRLIAYVHDKNLASRKLLEKVGFQEEGLLREHFLINGSFENEVLYGLLNSDV